MRKEYTCGIRDELDNLKDMKVGDRGNSGVNFAETQRKNMYMLTGIFKEKQLEGL